MNFFPATHQIWIAVAIDVVLVVVTILLLTKEDRSSHTGAHRTRHALIRTSGYLLLCLTFCWSVVVGCVFTLNAHLFGRL